MSKKVRMGSFLSNGTQFTNGRLERGDKRGRGETMFIRNYLAQAKLKKEKKHMCNVEHEEKANVRRSSTIKSVTKEEKRRGRGTRDKKLII